MHHGYSKQIQTAIQLQYNSSQSTLAAALQLHHSFLMTALWVLNDSPDGPIFPCRFNTTPLELPLELPYSSSTIAVCTRPLKDHPSTAFGHRQTTVRYPLVDPNRRWLPSNVSMSPKSLQ